MEESATSAPGAKCTDLVQDEPVDMALDLSVRSKRATMRTAAQQLGVQDSLPCKGTEKVVAETKQCLILSTADETCHRMEESTLEGPPPRDRSSDQLPAFKKNIMKRYFGKIRLLGM